MRVRRVVTRWFAVRPRTVPAGMALGGALVAATVFGGAAGFDPLPSLDGARSDTDEDAAGARSAVQPGVGSGGRRQRPASADRALALRPPAVAADGGGAAADRSDPGTGARSVGAGAPHPPELPPPLAGWPRGEVPVGVIPIGGRPAGHLSAGTDAPPGGPGPDFGDGFDPPGVDGDGLLDPPLGNLIISRPEAPGLVLRRPDVRRLILSRVDVPDLGLRRPDAYGERFGRQWRGRPRWHDERYDFRKRWRGHRHRLERYRIAPPDLAEPPGYEHHADLDAAGLGLRISLLGDDYRGRHRKPEQ